MLKSNMKVGDLVELASHVTRRGRPEDDQVGLVVEIRSRARGHADLHADKVAVVNFCGVLREYPINYLKLVGNKSA